MIILGIDPGFSKIGFAVLDCSENGKFKKLLHHQICITQRLDKKRLQDLRIANDDKRRLEEIHMAMVSIIEEYKPICVGVESYSPRAGFGTGWKSSFGYALTLMACLERKIPSFVFIPMDIKKRIAGKYNSSKEDVQKSIEKKYGLKFENLVPKNKKLIPKKELIEHLSDAVALGLLAAEEIAKLRKLAGFSADEDIV